MRDTVALRQKILPGLYLKGKSLSNPGACLKLPNAPGMLAVATFELEMCSAHEVGVCFSWKLQLLSFLFFKQALPVQLMNVIQEFNVQLRSFLYGATNVHKLRSSFIFLMPGG